MHTNTTNTTNITSTTNTTCVIILPLLLLVLLSPPRILRILIILTVPGTIPRTLPIPSIPSVPPLLPILSTPLEITKTGTTKPWNDELCIKDLAELIGKMYGVKVNIQQIPKLDQSPNRYVPSINRTLSLLENKTIVDITEAIQKTFVWYET